MPREVRFTLDDDQFSQLNELKDRQGYTWKGLMIEGAKEIATETAEFTDRDRLQQKVDGLKSEFGDREHYSTFRISTIESRSGDEILGISIRLMDTDQFNLVRDLEKIDRSLYDDGYNTAWSYEKTRPDDDPFVTENHPYEGATNALLIERGIPKPPEVPEHFRKASSHTNTH